MLVIRKRWSNSLMAAALTRLPTASLMPDQSYNEPQLVLRSRCLSSSKIAMIPYWNTAEATAKAHDFFEAAGIVLLALLVLAELAAYIYGHRHDALIKQAADTQAIKLQGLQHDLAAAEDKLRPRHLSPQQKILLVSRIQEYGWRRAEIIWVGHGEPETYARDLAKLFEEAHVPVDVHTLGPFIPSAWGLLVIKTTNDDSNNLKALLDEAGVKSEVALTNDTLGVKDHPTLVVGAREGTN